MWPYGSAVEQALYWHWEPEFWQAQAILVLCIIGIIVFAIEGIPRKRDDD